MIINKLADALGKTNNKTGGGGVGTDGRPIVIQLKINGRVLESEIIKAIDLVS